MEAMLWAHALSTILMTGVIWFVQVVHYPLFARVGSRFFEAYEREHQARTSLVVGPLMITEFLTAGVILFGGLADVRLAAIGFILVLVIWASTAFVQVPLHWRLAEGFDERAIRRLVLTNWVRTSAWSVRAVIALVMFVAGA